MRVKINVQNWPKGQKQEIIDRYQGAQGTVIEDSNTESHHITVLVDGDSHVTSWHSKNLEEID